MVDHSNAVIVLRLSILFATFVRFALFSSYVHVDDIYIVINVKCSLVSPFEKKLFTRLTVGSSCDCLSKI